jgi:hypothetical protein
MAIATMMIGIETTTKTVRARSARVSPASRDAKL